MQRLITTTLLVLACIPSFRQTSWVRINQIGYLPNSTKVTVFISHDEFNTGAFQVKEQKTGRALFTGAGIPANAERWGMKTAFRLNFSTLETPCEYYIECDGTKSPAFCIDANAYHRSADFILNYMRQQRCGYNPYLDTLCHQHDGYIVDQPVRSSEKIDVWGGWHDASDYLQYLPTSANAVFQMLFAWQQTPDKMIFKDVHDAMGRKGANGIPDILDEVRWGLDWMLKMNPDTDSQGAIVKMEANRKTVYLIFSADIAFEGGEFILQTLTKNNLKASFFLTGNCLRTKSLEPLIRNIIKQGHYVGGHSDNHLLYASWENRQQSLVSADSLIIDFRKNMNELARFGVDVSKLTSFLPPYEHYNKDHVRLIRSLGQKVINFTPSIRTAADYTTPDMYNYKTSQELIDQLYTCEEEHGLNGAIILIHPGTHESRTDKLYLRLDEIIKYLKKKGYLFERF